MNSVILIGRLTNDPELKYTPNGISVCSFGLAVDRAFTNAQGERETDFINIIVWQKLAENCAKHLGKGRMVAVDGRLQIRSYEDKQGIRRKVAEVVAKDVRFLDWPKERSQQNASQGKRNSKPAGGYDDMNGEGFASEISFKEEEIPF